jgi:hypothetical protein
LRNLSYYLAPYLATSGEEPNDISAVSISFTASVLRNREVLSTNFLLIFSPEAVEAMRRSGKCNERFLFFLQIVRAGGDYLLDNVKIMEDNIGINTQGEMPIFSRSRTEYGKS